MPPQDPTQRFTNRVADYVRTRPSYPAAVVDALDAACGGLAGSVVADVGSGTGILSELLLARGARVHAIEPNAAMRAAAEQRLGAHPSFASIDARAEATGLVDASVDLVAAAQAFHWFDARAARAEFARILAPGASVALLWNERRTRGTALLRGYEELLLRHSTDYAAVDHTRLDEADFAAFFGPAGYRAASFENEQRLDREGFLGRIESSSYVPARGQPGHAPLMAGMAALFDANQRDGRVTIEYDVRLLIGRISS